MSSNLATKLREGTKKPTQWQKTLGSSVLKGVVENSYRKLIGNFYFVYSAMEEEMERHRQHPIYQKFKELNRGRLEQDLSYYYGPNWRANSLQPVKSTCSGFGKYLPQPLNC